jgi:hemoglobin
MPDTHPKVEITTQEHVDHLVRSFYDKVLRDELLSPHFASVDLEHHLPRIAAFWALILIDQEGYKGNVFDRHAHLKIDNSHFNRWVALFTETVDEYFTGEKAELAKQRAKLLQYTFVSKLNQQG